VIDGFLTVIEQVYIDKLNSCKEGYNVLAIAGGQTRFAPQDEKKAKESSERYEQSEKGKAARKRVIANYKANRTTWTCHIDSELSDKVLALMPEGMTRTEFLEMIFRKYLSAN
jgi:hypothetical protein